MNITELIAAMAEASGLSKKDCEAALAAFITTTESALKAGNKVQLVGFGSFEVKERAARTGKNPATGEQIEIPASKSPHSNLERLSKTPSSNLKTHREALTVLIRKCFFFS